MDAEIHHAFFVGGVIKFGVAHGAGEVAKEEGNTLLVIPNVCAGAHATPIVIVITFPAKETSIGRAEASLCAQRAEVKESGFFDDIGQVTLGEGLHELKGLLFECFEFWNGFLRNVPGIAILRCIVVANAGVFAR